MTNLLEEIAKKRCEEISNELAKEPWYTDAIDEIIEMQKQIYDNGSSGTKDFLNKLIESCLKIQCETEERMYIQGFKDGASLK